jgi:hypothetical protein
VTGALAAATDAAHAGNRCETTNPRLARAWAGDFDYDGLSNCQERYELRTSPRDPDSDDDGMRDGDEVESGTDPRDSDSDDDGRSDGDEEAGGTDPDDPDSDDDGMDDGEDPDPVDDLRAQIEGDATVVTCDTSPSLLVLGIPIQLTPATDYRGVADCTELAAILTANGAVHVEVRVTGDLSTALVAMLVRADDGDGDGRPDEIDDDDDDDGVEDEDEDEDAGDDD